jgi:CheY-like chemotaxis protein
MRILLLHSDPEFARAVRGNLEGRGMTLVETSDGVQAIEMAVADPPDLILADLELTRLTGLEALRIIRAVKRLASIPAVILTDRADPEEIREAVELDAADYVLKSAFLRGDGAERLLKAARRPSPSRP